jgi:hypothetical protein
MAKVVIMHKDGTDGGSFELTGPSGFYFGKADDCDVRIRVAGVPDKQCKVVLQNGKVSDARFARACAANTLLRLYACPCMRSR